MAEAGAAIEVLRRWTPPTAEQARLRDLYVDHLAAHAHGLSKRCQPDHLTAGVLVISDDGRRVLLNLHRKAQRWFAFGGHIEDTDESLAAAALREGLEESGIADLVLDPEPVHLSLHAVPFCGDSGNVRHLDVRYVARVPLGTQPVVGDESLEIRWFDVDDLPTDEPDMVELIGLAGATNSQGTLGI